MGKTQFPRLETADVLASNILLGVPSFVRTRRRQGRKGVGIRYEEKVQACLLDEYPHYVASPWFQYRMRHAPNRVNYAQPDGLLIDVEKGVVTIVEIKYAHTPDAYFQLYNKYLPLVEAFFRRPDKKAEHDKRLWRFATIEVVRWYDGAVVFPCDVTLRERIDYARPDEFAVNICRP